MLSKHAKGTSHKTYLTDIVASDSYAPMESDTIITLVDEYRKTRSATLRDKIINCHMRLAIYTASRYMKFYRHHRREDLISAALEGLCQAVAWAPERLHDNNITPYISVTVRRFIRDYLEKDQLIPIPRKTFKKLAESGAVELIPYYREVEALETDDEENPYYGPDAEVEEALSTVDDPENLDNLISKICDNIDEETVVRMLLDGYKVKEVANELGCTHQWVYELRSKLRENYERRLGYGRVYSNKKQEVPTDSANVEEPV